ncbi:MAG: radical SAM protein, partial [DPANN group archaeon]|nr:radical SAM protein [DPANN group archaeon]
NAVLLSEEKADKLIEAGLTRFNVSMDSLDENLAEKMAGCCYNIGHVKKIIEYIGKKSDILIAPVWVDGWNDSQIEKLVEFAMKHCRGDVKLGIQNFLEYDKGRKPAKQMPWEEFYSRLKKLEEKYKAKLILNAEDFGIHRAKSLPKPFGKGDVVKATVMCEGMYGSEKIAAAEGRSINVFSCDAKIGSQVKVKILRDKHNCFAGKDL